MGVLVIYASTHGHTAKIAGRVAEALREEGVEVDLRGVGDADGADPGHADGVVVAASVHQGRHQDELIDWVRHHHRALEARPTLFVSVSLTAAEDSDEARAATRECIDVFLDDTGWTPERCEPVAGALQYREYDFFTRTLIRLMMKRGGHPTDTSRDYDYTDWDGVDRLAREFAKRVAGG